MVASHRSAAATLNRRERWCVEPFAALYWWLRDVNPAQGTAQDFALMARLYRWAGNRTLARVYRLEATARRARGDYERHAAVWSSLAIVVLLAVTVAYMAAQIIRATL